MNLSNLSVYIDESNFDPFKLQEFKQLLHGYKIHHLGRENKGLQAPHEFDSIAVIGVAREISSYKLIFKKNKVKFFHLLSEEGPELKTEENEFYFNWDHKDFVIQSLSLIKQACVDKNIAYINDVIKKQNSFLDKSLRKIDYKEWTEEQYQKVRNIVESLKDKINLENIERINDIFQEKEVLKELQKMGLSVRQNFEVSDIFQDHILFLDAGCDQKINLICFDCHFPLKNLVKDISGEAIVFFFASLMRHISLIKGRRNKIQEYSNLSQNYKDEFNSLEFPIALMSKNGDFLFYNTEFSKSRILPKECLELKNGQKFEKEKQFFEVVRAPIVVDNDEIIFFAFKRPNTSAQAQSAHLGQEQLGIVASSIAHEINNPLAGILASLTLIDLMDGLTSSQKEQCEDMKISAKRCKELIGVFLGFSRADINRAQGGTSLKSSFEQAMSLIRFRMAETNVRLEIKVDELEKSSLEFNSSIMSMIFYLILNDLLTHFSHYMLVANKTREMAVISGHFSFNGKKLILNLDDKNLKRGERSRLLDQLLVSQSLELE